MPSYKIFLADDHVLVRQGIKRIIQEKPGLEVAGEADDGLELLELLEKSVPDMVILDISMPRLRGLEALKMVRKLYPKIKILILTMHKNKEYLYQAMSNGANGYVLKEDADLSLLAAIDTVRSGKNFISYLLFS